jgi:hypothetical protein
MPILYKMEGDSGGSDGSLWSVKLLRRRMLYKILYLFIYIILNCTLIFDNNVHP